MAEPEAAARQLPSVDELLSTERLSEARAILGHGLVVQAARDTLGQARRVLMAGEEERAPQLADLAGRAAESAWAVVQPSHRRVINATGVVVHTNLGRAPLCESAVAAMREVADSASSIELDLSTGRRGDRHDHLQGVLRQLLGVEAAMVVNNNAAAVLLTLMALARGREVVLSRGEAVEIGGAFRVPDIMRRSGAKLVEVGTTNRTYVADYAQAITQRTAALLAVHSSNFRVVGFVHAPSLAELGALAREQGVPLLHDLGSGCLLDTTSFGLAAEPTAQASVQAGVGVLCFSGDKLLGGPQAGIIAGRADLIARIKRDPLARALRVDKLTVAALHATLVEYLKGSAVQHIPVWRMIALSLEDLRRRAEAWASSIPGADVVEGRSAIGGGSLPGETLPTMLLRLPGRLSAERVLGQLRRQPLPVIARVEERRVLLDPRTVRPEDDASLLAGIHAALAG